MNKIKIEVTKREAERLKFYLISLVGKGSLSTTPSWARKLIRKIKNKQESYDPTT